MCANGTIRAVVVDKAFSSMVYSYLREMLETTAKSQSVLDLLKPKPEVSTDIGE